MADAELLYRAHQWVNTFSRVDPPADARQSALDFARELIAEDARMNDLHCAITLLFHYPDGWPDHGNVPLAIAASVALLIRERDSLRALLAKLRVNDGECLGDHPAWLAEIDDALAEGR